MFQHPVDVIDSEMEESTPRVACRDFLKTEECQILPCFQVKEDMLKRIDCKTVRRKGDMANVVVGYVERTIPTFV
jgi:hypothetical protein